MGCSSSCSPGTCRYPGSYWGASEAGLRGERLLVRPDTPIHSALHEGSHFICMNSPRRTALDRDAGGDDLEEAAVCYLQVLLAAQLPGVGGARLMRDMDAWGYSFRLGSTQAWYQADAQDARDWLLREASSMQRARSPGTCAPDTPAFTPRPGRGPCCTAAGSARRPFEVHRR